MISENSNKIAYLISAGKFIEENFRKTKKMVAAKSASAVILQAALTHPDQNARVALIDIAVWIMIEFLMSKRLKPALETERIHLISMLENV